MHFHPFIFWVYCWYVYFLHLIVFDFIHFAQSHFSSGHKIKRASRTLFIHPLFTIYVYLFSWFRKLLRLSPACILHYRGIVDLDHLASPLAGLSAHFLGKVPVKAGYRPKSHLLWYRKDRLLCSPKKDAGLKDPRGVEVVQRACLHDLVEHPSEVGLA